MFNQQQVIKKAQAGDQKARAQLYGLHIDPLYRFVRHKVDTNERAEDICAEAFLKAFEKFESFSGQSSFKTWIYTIARNLIIDWYQVKNIEVELSDYQAADETDGNQNAEKAESQVKQILFNLKDNYAEVLEMRFLMRMSIKEVAAVLEISESNVKVLQNRALNRARELAAKLTLK